MRVHYPKLRNIVHTIYLHLIVFIASKGSKLYILFTLKQLIFYIWMRCDVIHVRRTSNENYLSYELHFSFHFSNILKFSCQYKLGG